MSLAPTQMRPLQCLNCEADFKGEAWRKYCSRSCSNLHRFGYEKPPAAPEGMKVCLKCEVVKPLDAFHTASGNRDGRQGKCKDCQREAAGTRFRRGEFGKCGAKTFFGKVCQNDAGPEGTCAVHDGRKSHHARQPIENLHLHDEIRELAALGFGQGAIAQALHVGSLKVAVTVWGYAGRSDPEAVAEAQAVVAAWREAAAAERDSWREEARRIVREGEERPWEIPEEPEVERAPEEDAELRALMEAQEKEQARERRDAPYPAYAWDDLRASYVRPRFIVSLDAPSRPKKGDGDFGGSRHHALESKHSLDPFRVLTEGNADTLRELIGDLDVEDVEAMSFESVQRLQQRLREAGIPRPSVQESERERLREPEPHHGNAPPVQQRGMHPKHRGRNEASKLHRTRGKRFVRRNSKKAKDGWGSVEIP